IRGRGSIYGDNEPLYVIDGMPVEVTTGHGLSWLNPGDIQRIEILKDASATAVYGMRGANGVVLITTRHGERAPEEARRWFVARVAPLGRRRGGAERARSARLLRAQPHRHHVLRERSQGDRPPHACRQPWE